MNKVTGPMSKLKDEIDATGLKMIGDVPYDDKVVGWNLSNKSVFEFNDKEMTAKIKTVCENLLKGEYVDRACKGKV